MSAPNDALLHVLTVREKLDWSQFKEVTDQLLIAKPGMNPYGISTRMQRERLLRCIVGLGHCDISEEASGRVIYSAPSFAARLPIAGLPTMVLCGARSPTTVEVVKGLVRRTECSIQVEQQIDCLSFLPDRISIQGTNEPSMTDLCELIGVKTLPAPSGWAILANSANISQILDKLTWVNSRTPDWPGATFNAEALRFYDYKDSSNEEMILERFSHPRRGTMVHFLKTKNGRAECRLDWARYILLSEIKRNVLFYDDKRGNLVVPIATPFPTLLARALILCSGFSPQLVSSKELGFQDWGGELFDLYRWVPSDFANRLAHTVGQILVPSEIEFP